jgi:hypothetical protein
MGDRKTKLVAVLWFVTSVLALTAALITRIKSGNVEWALYAATVFSAMMGWMALQRSRSGGT